MRTYRVTINNSGQIAIPTAIRQALELKVGDRLDVSEIDEESFYVVKAEEKTEPIDQKEATSL